MTYDQISRTFFDFFRERGHRLGRPHPLGRRLVNVQRCLRTTDLDEVGDRTHLTLFQMLGSWSLGDYDLPQSLRWGYELLQRLGVEHDRMYATVFGGDH